MATASDIVTGALKKLGIHAAQTPIEAFEMEDAIKDMNDLLIEWEVSKILTGFEAVKEPADVIRIPRYAEGAAKLWLAMRIASDYDKPISLTLATEADRAMNSMLVASTNITVEFPSTLPIGSGSSCNDDNLGRRFFTGTTKENF